MIKAVILEQQEKKTIPTVKQIDESMLPEGNVTVDVEWSGINYKDAMAVTGTGKIIRQFPMVPGIDFAGKVSQSDDPRYQLGQEVILTGWGVGETHWGGMAEKARINADWLVHLPVGMSSREAMIIGTAGFTAMLCVMGLEDGHVKPEDGEILVTGASGGVGSTAVVLLNALGYTVVAVSPVKNWKKMLAHSKNNFGQVPSIQSAVKFLQNYSHKWITMRPCQPVVLPEVINYQPR